MNETNSNIVVSRGVLESTDISLEELQQHLGELKRILGVRFDEIVPTKIKGVPRLYWVVNLSKKLQMLKNCEGFDKHIETYKGNQIKSSYFVTIVASYLVDKVDSIILEPTIAGKSTKSDILVNLQGNNIYIECKIIDTSRFNYLKEHNHMLSILKQYINVPHQISIKYQKSLSDEELHQLGKTLKERGNLPRGDGIIINNPGLEVQLFRRAHYADKRFRLVMDMISEDLNENCSYPAHAYSEDGITISLSGPKVDYKEVLRERFRKSKRQSPIDCPYVLVIDGSMILGDLKEHIRALSTAFQPKRNTRFSAVVLVKYHLKLDSPAIKYNFYFVSNPFAEFPIYKEFELLFRNRN